MRSSSHLTITDQLLGRKPVADRAQLQADVETGLQQIGMHHEEAAQVAQRLANPGEAGRAHGQRRNHQHDRSGDAPEAAPAPRRASAGGDSHAAPTTRKRRSRTADSPAASPRKAPPATPAPAA